MISKDIQALFFPLSLFTRDRNFENMKKKNEWIENEIL